MTLHFSGAAHSTLQRDDEQSRIPSASGGPRLGRNGRRGTPTCSHNTPVTLPPSVLLCGGSAGGERHPPFPSPFPSSVSACPRNNRNSTHTHSFSLSISISAPITVTPAPFLTLSPSLSPPPPIAVISRTRTGYPRVARHAAASAAPTRTPALRISAPITAPPHTQNPGFPPSFSPSRQVSTVPSDVVATPRPSADKYVFPEKELSRTPSLTWRTVT